MFALECIREWQHKHRVTVYTTSYASEVIQDAGIDGNKVLIKDILKKPFKGYGAKVLNATILQAMWSRQIDIHEVYFAHLWPTHHLSLRPLVWYPHEPLRILHDLRYEGRLENIQGKAKRLLHTYPNRSYDDLQFELGNDEFEALLSIDHVKKDITVVANSKYSMNYINSVYGDVCKSYVYPGISACREPEKFIPRSDNLILTIGQLWSHKRISIIIRAMKYVDNAKLLILGSGPDHDHYINLIVNEGLEDKVYIYTEASNAERDRLLARATVFVYAAIREPFGMVVLEAMANGVPVVAVKEGGYPEVLDDAGIYTPPTSINIASNITLLLKNKELRDKLSHMSKEKSRLFTWRNTANQLESIIEEAVINHRECNDCDLRSNDDIRGKLYAHFYAWYDINNDSRHWNDSPLTQCTETPLRGNYCSYSQDILSSQIADAKWAGINGFIVSLHLTDQGVDHVELETLECLKNVCPADFDYTVMLVFNTLDLKVLKIARKLIQSVLKSNQCSFMDDKKVISVYLNDYCLDDVVYSEIVKYSSDYKLLFFGQYMTYQFRELPIAQLASGYSLYNPWSIGTHTNIQRILKEESKSNHGTLKMATISPGYNDSHLEDIRRSASPRRYPPEGDNRSKQDILVESIRLVGGIRNPNALTVLNSYNEYHENTHIEPTFEAGNALLEFLRSATKNSEKVKK